jgi:hypothetical protein
MDFKKLTSWLYHKEPNIHPKAKGEGIEWAYIRLSPDSMTQRQNRQRQDLDKKFPYAFIPALLLLPQQPFHKVIKCSLRMVRCANVSHLRTAKLAVVTYYPSHGQARHVHLAWNWASSSSKPAQLGATLHHVSH